MSTPAEIIQEMINAADGKAANAQTSIDQITLQISDLQEKQDSMQTGILDVVSSNLENYLVGTKFSPASDYHMKKGSTYNDGLSSSGTLTDWEIYQLRLSNLDPSKDSIIYDSPNTFTCTGDKTAIFSDTTDVAFNLNGTYVYSVVSGSPVFMGGITTVTIADSVLTINLMEGFTKNYVYSLGDDTYVDKYVGDWDFAHDYIVHPLGSTGTYGTKDMISNLTSAKNMLELDKTKFIDSKTKFADYV